MKRIVRSCGGQMTVEAMVALPAMIAIALIVVNALLFFDACATFDRQMRFAVCIYATAPAHGAGQGASQGLVQQAVQDACNRDYLAVSVGVRGHAPGWVTYTGELRFTPTLFGRAFSGSVFGVALPSITHTTELTIDPYRPGAIV